MLPGWSLLAQGHWTSGLRVQKTNELPEGPASEAGTQSVQPILMAAPALPSRPHVRDNRMSTSWTHGLESRHQHPQWA